MQVLFIRNGRERFVLQDLDLLRRHFHVTDWHQPHRHYNVYKLIQYVREHDLIYCWFASWHAFAPVTLGRIFGKPAIVIVGGYDTANVPEAGYGSQRGGVPRLIARSIIRQASQLVVNSCAAHAEAVRNAHADPMKLKVIYHGVEPVPVGRLEQREPMALTVGGVWRENLLRKGLLPFVQAAAYLPHVRFVVAGKWFDDGIHILRQTASPNVEFRGFVSNDELAHLYAQASVYVQASLHEGFGLSLAEAMSAGCMPVVTRAGALPEVAGEAAVYLDSNEPRQIAQGIAQGMMATAEQRLQVSNHIIHSFRLSTREQSLQALVRQALQPKVAAQERT